ncbi:MAG TPA: nucleotidyltransferase family protein [Steroidobacteraceae bacterium]|nr:nucleotidyltransferase family protein [Steroidobacteraceae bacterium]
MVLAAGRGERLRPLTDTLPKPLVQAGGRPLIVWHLEALRRAGITEVVINLSWLGERLKAALGDGRDFGVRITYSEEGPVALETGGGILRALPHLGPGPFLVVSGDIWTDFDFGTLALEHGSLGQLVLVPNPAHHPRGDFGLSGGRILAAAAATERFTYGNIGLYRPEFFAGCADGRFPLLEPLNRAIAAGRLGGQLYLGRWCDVGTPERLAQLNAGLAQVQ